jgi:hypothetical protein
MKFESRARRGRWTRDAILLSSLIFKAAFRLAFQATLAGARSKDGFED